MPIPSEHFQRLRRWMALEADAEKEKALRDSQKQSPAAAEASGYSLIHLVIRGEDGGLGGRILLTLGKRNQTLEIPWTRLGVGTPVILSEEGKGGDGWRGVVSRVSRESIEVAFAQWPEPDDERGTFRLDRSSDEVSRQRQLAALERAENATENSRLAVLRNVLLGNEAAQFTTTRDYVALDNSLNASQQEAVRFALGAEDVAIIHGPPGTGKTTTVVELVRQLVQRGQTVLVCAPSNLAVDNVLERLLAHNEKAMRLGHPARVLPELREHTLDLMAKNHPDMKVVEKLTRESYALRAQAGKYTRAKPEPGARNAMRQEAKQMLADARQIEDQVVERLLNAAKIICATTTGLDPDMLGRLKFDWCVIDEASQSTEPGAWAPLQYAQRLVLAGDHFQLPPTIISPEAAAQGFNISLMERLVKQNEAAYARRLIVQYRMHTDIMTFSSQEFYDGDLMPAPFVARHLLCDLPDIMANDLTETPVHFVDTAGAGYEEKMEPEGDSRYNPQEAEVVLRYTQRLLEAGVRPIDLAIITPYSAHAKHIREYLPQLEIEIDTVDGFQGREKEAVIVSLVRSNQDGEIGFLADIRRMNVALTRARRKLIVVGDSATITNHLFYQRLVAYFESINAYHSVWEE